MPLGFTSDPRSGIGRCTEADSIRAALEAVLRSHPTSWPLQPAIGLQLEPAVGVLTPAYRDALTQTVTQAIQTWEPRARVESVHVIEVDNNGLRSFTIRITYRNPDGTSARLEIDPMVD